MIEGSNKTHDIGIVIPVDARVLTVFCNLFRDISESKFAFRNFERYTIDFSRSQHCLGSPIRNLNI